jgi:hypothetical protein
MSDPVRILKDGYWDRTSVVRAADGALRVRKESKVTATPGPWAHAALRREIDYLRFLPDEARPHFPPLLDAWDDATIGYEIPFYEDRSDLTRLLRDGTIDQRAADDMQSLLAAAIFRGVHRARPQEASGFADHVSSVISASLEALSQEDRFRPLIEPERVRIDARNVRGMNASLRVLRERDLFARFEAGPQVLLHGDLILENILVDPLVLIDPVSVAGLASGPPLFDLVKYESYATGRLYAIRQALVQAGPMTDGYAIALDDAHPGLRRFREIDLITRFRAEYSRVHGEVDPALHALLLAYFDLVMARNTKGVEQWARVIGGCESLHQAAGTQG